VTDREFDKLQRLLDAVLAVASDLSLPVVLHRITEAACELVDARFGALGVVGSDDTLAEFVTVGVDIDTIEAIGARPKGKGILGTLIHDPRPLRIDDLSTHPDSYGFPEGHPVMRSFLGAPIRVRGEVFGNLYLCEKRSGNGFTGDDEELVVALAAAAGVAIENARLHTVIREYAVLEDRERIGRDLHDKVIQRLFATGMALQSTSRRCSDPDVAQRLAQSVDDLDETIREIRSTIFALGRTHGGPGSLRADILSLAGEATSKLGFEPRVTFDGPVDALVGDDIADHLLAVLREALINVAKHADAKHVSVVVSASDELLLRVNDDGKGIDPGQLGAGLGLTNLSSRASTLGGDLRVSIRPGGGTSLEWRVPLQAVSGTS